MKWHYTTIHFQAMNELRLSAIEYVFSDLTYHQSGSGNEWWTYSPSEVGELLGVDEKTIRRVASRCVEKGTILKDSDKLMSSQTFIDVVYPRNGHNYRLDGQNTRLQTGKTPALYNIYSKKNSAPLADSRRLAIEPEASRFGGEDSYLDGSSGDSKSPRISGNKRKAYDELIAWSENERGFPFLITHRTKQYAAFKMANKNGITREQLMERWEEMSGDKFWQKAGFDWSAVVSSFNTKPV